MMGDGTWRVRVGDVHAHSSVRSDGRAMVRDLFALLTAHWAPSADARADITVTCVPRAASAPVPHGNAAFFHGAMRAYPDAQGFVLVDAHTTVRVAADGAAIEVAVDDDVDDEGLAESAHVTLFFALLLALRTRGLFHLHAAGVVDDSGAGVVVVGNRGAGKTTTTLALIEAGFSYLADDTLLVQRSAQGAQLLAFAKAFHVAPRTLDAFARLRPFAGHVLGPRNDKRVLDASRAWPTAHVPLMRATHLLVFPSVTTHAQTTAAPLLPAQTFGALLESSALGVVDGVDQVHDQLTLLQTLSSTPALSLALGADALRDPSRIAELVRDALRSAR